MTVNDAIKISSTYSILKDITYVRATGIDVTLDAYVPKNNFDRLTGKIKDNVEPLTTVVFFHGGGWIDESKEQSALQLLPYLSKGWCAVNVSYRLGTVARAPAAVEDARSAVWWVKRNCKQYGFDPERIVLTGQSAGGHLALMAGILPSDAGFDTQSPHQNTPENIDSYLNASLPELKVAAIINWAGIIDVSDLIKEPNMRSYALQWLGGDVGAEQLSQRLSPINYIRNGLPPILTLHGDCDAVVPYDHAIQLHTELEHCDVPNQLHTIKGKAHFDFDFEDIVDAHNEIDCFLANYVE